MLVKLLPDQISNHWDELSSAIKGSLPPFVADSDVCMINILKAALSGDLHCWIMYADNGTKTDIYAVITTMIWIDKITGTRDLLIYTFYATKPLLKDLLLSGFETLRKFAADKNCYKIIAYTNVPEMESIVTMLGGVTDMKFVELEV